MMPLCLTCLYFGMLQVLFDCICVSQHGNLSDSEIAAHLYDQFNITISDIKVLLADSGNICAHFFISSTEHMVLRMSFCDHWMFGVCRPSIRPFTISL